MSKPLPPTAPPAVVQVLAELEQSLRAATDCPADLNETSEAELAQSLVRALLSSTGARHAFILLRAPGGRYAPAFDSGAGEELEWLLRQSRKRLAAMAADAPRILEVRGMPYCSLPLIGMRRKLGVMYFDLAHASMIDIVPLTQLAARGASQLEALHESNEKREQIRRLQEQLDIVRGVADALLVEHSVVRGFLDSIPDMIFAKDRNGRFMYGNLAAIRAITGQYDGRGLIGRSDFDFYSVEQAQRYVTDEQRVLRSGSPLIDQVEENVSGAGQRRFFSTSKYPVLDEGGRQIGVVGISRDITVQIDSDQAESLRAKALESSQDGILIVHSSAPGNPIVYANAAFERITGFSRAEAQLIGIGQFLVDHDAGAQLDGPLDAVLAGLEERWLVNARTQDGAPYICEVRLAVIRAPDGAPTHHVFSLADVSATIAAERQLTRMAGHDALTGLPNRRLLMERLGLALSLAERGSLEVSVAFFDLDGLKSVNDTHGHEAGDALLRVVAERVAGTIREADTFARLGGDEFVLVALHEVAQAGAARHAMRELLVKLQAVIARPIGIGVAEVSVSCSIGVSQFGRNGVNAEQLVNAADRAMYAAKSAGRNRIVFAPS